MRFVPDDEVIKASVTNASVKPLEVSILPGTPSGRDDFLNSHGLDYAPEQAAERESPVPNEKPRGGLPRERFSNLLGRPLSRWMADHVEM
jgi:hypothetical protein